jgi:plasmid stability protein
MAQLIVRNLDEDTVRRLKLRAVRNGRSMEAETREILREVLSRRRDLKDLLLDMPCVGKDSDFARRREKPRRVEL